ncbi:MULTISPECIES: imidazoleglycerol-phosphate dehydratase HisB [Staphylococcus]|uniref:Imidazoleglycerol-phosphate dehydratase n=1 Tax=Staphylococcus schleiferi TaxID=1295 RepID=A0A7Z7VW84_STASC|nr:MULTISPECIES: imidazoleglycerol-phosphate dehydratase HisB [Staphylococcus]QGS46315.1 imidazoleglycerol-phosphate dehydratase HisB [Mammaliicoccus fleurettii]EPD49053.1 imidazoleglycerol-phosphate dehydratase [Staphylococcus sp. HGB0015]MBF1993439.1 imidazoleglycerol-phosphate dehydratase HisB [Staphylococcus schleiferi]MBF2038884.1 imidazoleglycerol-phosphate dehydratase HisB [Staphylococcus schleiferi]MBF2100910.1 imidazoleglycerol-phosphate dehydratase HisB [Staphylococcus schleiferi]
MTYQIRRETTETKIDIKLSVSKKESQIHTGVGFLDHMLTLWSFHSGLALQIDVEGDTWVDDHHTTEDIGIVLGQLLRQLIKDKVHYTRYGTQYIPMDETLARAVVDISGRPYLNFQADFSKEKVGQFDTELVKEFFRALVFNAYLTVHIDLLHQGNTHHEIEAIFKAFAHALKQALRDSEDRRIPSSKGVIE